MHPTPQAARRVTRLWLLSLTLASVAASADWPWFRGPGQEGMAADGERVRAWSDAPPTVVWRQPIGAGYSSVSVVGDRLFTMDADGEKEYVVCFGRQRGETIWRIEAGDFVQAELGDGGPRSTPSVADGIVYAVTSQAEVVALAVADGSRIWRKDLGEMGPAPRFGYASSPVVDGEAIILEVGDKDSSPGIVALDRRSGDVLWSSLEGPAGYSSALIAELGGQRQYVLFRRAGQEAVALSTSGEVLWRFPTPEALAAIVMPILVPPDRIFISTSDDSFGGHLIRIVRREGVLRAEEVWSQRLMRNHFNTSVPVGDYLYGFDNGTLRCLDLATGEGLWARRGFGKGSLVAADGYLFVLSDAGLVAQVRARPDAFEELGRIQVTEGRSWTAPSLAGGRLYVRDFDELVSLEVGAGVTTGEQEAP